jgi:hypothetical protein
VEGPEGVRSSRVTCSAVRHLRTFEQVQRNGRLLPKSCRCADDTVWGVPQRSERCHRASHLRRGRVLPRRPAHHNITYGFPAAGGITTLANIDRSFLNVAPEFSLLYLPNTKWQFRGRVATGYATPAASNLTITSAGVPGNHGQPQTQENLGFDVGAN